MRDWLFMVYWWLWIGGAIALAVAYPCSGVFILWFIVGLLLYCFVIGPILLGGRRRVDGR